MKNVCSGQEEDGLLPAPCLSLENLFSHTQTPNDTGQEMAASFFLHHLGSEPLKEILLLVV